MGEVEPVMLLATTDATTRQVIGSELRRRYGGDYEIVVCADYAHGRAVLEGLRHWHRQVALVIAWSFELTAEGLKRDTGEEVPRLVSVSAGRKFDFAIITALVAALGYFVATRPSSDVTAPVRGASGEARTLAVLPFANLSGDPTQAYFSEGIAEELRSALTRIAGLRVAGRTSSEAVRDEDAKSIARKLGVRNVLTGSVRRSSNVIRVSA